MLKLNPYYTYQIDAIESWLDEQAQKGLFLDDLVGNLFSFVKGEPKQVRYRIDLKDGVNYTEDQARIADYREFGWEYVCELSSHADIYVTHDPTAVELNTDEETLHDVLDSLLKREIAVGIVGTVLVPLLWLYNLWPDTKGYYGVYDSIVNGLSPFLTVFTVLLILTWTIPMALHLWDAVQTRRRMLLDRTYHTDSRAKKRQALHRSVLATALLILVSVGVLWGYTQSDTDITAEEFGPSITVLFPGHQSSSFRPHTNIPDEMFRKSSMPLNRTFYGRQWGHEILNADAFDLRQTWTYNADMEHVYIQWLAEKYAAEQAEVKGLEPVAFPDWENAWFAVRTDDSESPTVFSQQLVLQNGKDVWSFSYWTYDEAPQYDLLSAVKTYWQANPTHIG